LPDYVNYNRGSSALEAEEGDGSTKGASEAQMRLNRVGWRVRSEAAARIAARGAGSGASAAHFDGALSSSQSRIEQERSDGRQR
jgi:hypothetical protein